MLREPTVAARRAPRRVLVLPRCDLGSSMVHVLAVRDRWAFRFHRSFSPEPGHHHLPAPLASSASRRRRRLRPMHAGTRKPSAPQNSRPCRHRDWRRSRSARPRSGRRIGHGYQHLSHFPSCRVSSRGNRVIILQDLRPTGTFWNLVCGEGHSWAGLASSRTDHQESGTIGVT